MSDGPKRIHLGIDIDPDQYDAIQEIADRTGVARDDVVRRALAIGLAAIRHGQDDREKRPPTASQ
jgi:hypothetical protein